ncbi:hypothetical protein [Coleofasciculus sp. E1-EBD-02]|uniref:hypothetical protein n=1 Tax=Coleofasciculus sp. E1-EBD-02 TaxID=3068481 RepID=UPI0032F7C399
MNQHPRLASPSHLLSPRQNLAIASCIQVEVERISRSQVLFHGVRFTLDKEILHQIQQAQQMGDSLKLSRQLLTDLRYYALIDDENRWQSGLTFCTYYQRGNSQEALMRSVIGMDGDIMHQIQRNCLERPKFSHQISAAHYWLIEQIMGQLRLGTFLPLTRLINGLALGLALLIAMLLVIPFIPVFLKTPFMLIAALVMIGLFFFGFRHLLHLLRPTANQWIIRRILGGFLSSKPGSKRFAKRLLTRLFSS